MSKNKILAVSFLTFACLCFFSFYLLLESEYSWAYFRSTSWTNLLVFLLDAVVYLILLTCNIRNDDFAYTGIALFVSMETFGFIQRLYYGQMLAISQMSSGSIAAGIFYSLYISFLAMEAGVGVALYVFVMRYRRGLCSFKLVRIFSILFAAVLTLATFVSSISYWTLIASSWRLLISYIALPLAESSASVGIIFTLERLRR